MKLKDRVALVAGGAGSMGSAVARLFAQEGAAICVADMDGARAEGVVKEIVDKGGRAMAVELDVCQSEQWDAAVAAAEARVDELEDRARGGWRVARARARRERGRAPRRAAELHRHRAVLLLFLLVD